MKYKYIGTEPVIIYDYNVELQPDEIIELDGEVNSPLLIPYKEAVKETKKGVSE